MTKTTLHTRYKIFKRRWNNSHLFRSSGKLLLIAIAIGIFGGLGAAGFHWVLEVTKKLILGDIGGFSNLYGQAVDSKLPTWLFFIIPTLGGLVSGIIVYTFAPEAEGHGTDAMIDAFHNKGGRVRARVPFVKAISSIVTIGTGGSAGYEGPIAQIGSGLGSIFSKIFGVPEKMSRLLVLAGTAAGLGAIFRAPLGGALTSVEIIYKEDFESEAFLPSIVASVVAYATYSQVTHVTGPLFKIPPFEFRNPGELVFYAMLGILCAPVSWLYIRSFYFSVDSFKKLRIPNHFKPAIGGLGVGLIAYVCPRALGGGWEFLQEAINGQLAIRALLLIAAFKIITTSLTVGSGGSGGVFGPSLFIGGMLGGFVGFGIEQIAPGLIDNPSSYILVGMGAFFAGAANAPIASIIMVCEITGNYNLLAPLMLASVFHILLSRRWSIYRNQKQNKFESPAHRDELNTDILRSISVGFVFKPVGKVLFVNQNDNLNDLRRFLEETEFEVFPVVNENQDLTGLLSINQLRKVILETSANNLVIAEDLMTDVYALKREMDLHTASQVFLRSNHSELPVLNNKGVVLGLIKYQHIIQAYDEILQA